MEVFKEIKVFFFSLKLGSQFLSHARLNRCKFNCFSKFFTFKFHVVFARFPNYWNYSKKQLFFFKSKLRLGHSWKAKKFFVDYIKRHYCLTGKTVQIAAAVGLLTRNVKIIGAEYEMVKRAIYMAWQCFDISDYSARNSIRWHPNLLQRLCSSIQCWIRSSWSILSRHNHNGLAPKVITFTFLFFPKKSKS